MAYNIYFSGNKVGSIWKSNKGLEFMLMGRRYHNGWTMQGIIDILSGECGSMWKIVEI